MRPLNSGGNVYSSYSFCWFLSWKQILLPSIFAKVYKVPREKEAFNHEIIIWLDLFFQTLYCILKTIPVFSWNSPIAWVLFICFNHWKWSLIHIKKKLSRVLFWRIINYQACTTSSNLSSLSICSKAQSEVCLLKSRSLPQHLCYNLGPDNQLGQKTSHKTWCIQPTKWLSGLDSVPLGTGIKLQDGNDVSICKF